MPTFKNPQQLESFIKNAINIALNNDSPVMKTVRDTMIEKVQEEVFDAYPYPLAKENAYQRRDEGGIDDPQNIKGILISDGTIEVTNETLADPYIIRNGEQKESKNAGMFLAPIIEYGEGYEFHYKDFIAGYDQPRPFFAKTREELESSSALKKALYQGLREQGLHLSNL
jgi:hypothetical protein